MKTLLSIFNSVTKDELLYLLEKLPPEEIEEVFSSYPENTFEFSWRDVFYEHTFSLEFLEQHLCHDDVKFWTYVSEWYPLTLDFCRRNILHLNIEALQLYQLTISDKWLREQALLYYGSPEQNNDDDSESEEESEEEEEEE
jgi:hypothetical protein